MSVRPLVHAAAVTVVVDLHVRFYLTSCRRRCVTAGAVVRPLVGVSGGVTKVLEGVANTTRMFDKRARRKQRPHPRVFYGPHRVLRVYDPDEATLAAFVRSLNSGEFAKDVYMGGVSLADGALVVTDRRLMVVGNASGSLDLMLPWLSVAAVRRDAAGTVLTVVSASSRVGHTLRFDNPALATTALKLIEQSRPQRHAQVLV